VNVGVLTVNVVEQALDGFALAAARRVLRWTPSLMRRLSRISRLRLTQGFRRPATGHRHQHNDRTVPAGMMPSILGAHMRTTKMLTRSVGVMS